MNTPLEDLLTRALVKQTAKKVRRLPDDKIDVKELAQAERRLRERFSNPENWEKVRTVTLVHDASDTLLGNFIEYKHKLSKGVCRKFIRVEGPAPVDAIERVQGDNWHAAPLHPHAPDKLEHEEREAMVDLHLPELDNVYAPSTLVLVHLAWGGIARVELMDETRFFSKDRRIQLMLPAGLDVLEGMSLDCKLELRKFLEL